MQAARCAGVADAPQPLHAPLSTCAAQYTRRSVHVPQGVHVPGGWRRTHAMGTEACNGDVCLPGSTKETAFGCFYMGMLREGIF